MPPLVVPPGAERACRVSFGLRARTRRPSDASSAASLIVESFEAARDSARVVTVPVATEAGEVFQGRGVVEGGARQRRARHPRSHGPRSWRCGEDVRRLASAIAGMTADLAALDGRSWTPESRRSPRLSPGSTITRRRIVGLEAQASRASDEHARVDAPARGRHHRARARDRRSSSRRSSGATSASSAIETQESGQREAEGRSWRRARAAAGARARRRKPGCGWSPRAAPRQAALVERASALSSRGGAPRGGRPRSRGTRSTGRQSKSSAPTSVGEELRESIVETRAAARSTTCRRSIGRQGRDARARRACRGAARPSSAIAIRRFASARHALEGVRAEVTRLEVSRARAMADLAHLETACARSRRRRARRGRRRSSRSSKTPVSSCHRRAAPRAPDDDEDESDASSA